MVNIGHVLWCNVRFGGAEVDRYPVDSEQTSWTEQLPTVFTFATDGAVVESQGTCTYFANSYPSVW